MCVLGQEKVISMGKQSAFNMTFADRKQGRPLFANVSRGHKYYMAQVSKRHAASRLFPHDKCCTNCGDAGFFLTGKDFWRMFNSSLPA